MEITYTGTKECISNVIKSLPSTNKAKSIRTFKNSIIIPTYEGPKQVFIGDVIKIEEKSITIKHKE